MDLGARRALRAGAAGAGHGGGRAAAAELAALPVDVDAGAHQAQKGSGDHLEEKRGIQTMIYISILYIVNVHERSFVVSRLQSSLELSLGRDVFSGGLCSDFPDSPQNRLKSFLEEGEHSILTSCTMTVSRGRSVT